VPQAVQRASVCGSRHRPSVRGNEAVSAGASIVTRADRPGYVVRRQVAAPHTEPVVALQMQRADLKRPALRLALPTPASTQQPPS
jgi:hypothetical protein